MIKDVPGIIFPKSGSKRPPFFDKGPKKSVQNPAECYSKPCKMKTNGPTDLKLGLKYFLEYPLHDKRCSQKFFFQNCGLKGVATIATHFNYL